MVENTVNPPGRSIAERAKDIAAKVDDLNDELFEAAKAGLMVEIEIERSPRSSIFTGIRYPKILFDFFVKP